MCGTLWWKRRKPKRLSTRNASECHAGVERVRVRIRVFAKWPGCFRHFVLGSRSISASQCARRCTFLTFVKGRFLLFVVRREQKRGLSMNSHVAQFIARSSGHVTNEKEIDARDCPTVTTTSPITELVRPTSLPRNLKGDQVQRRESRCRAGPPARGPVLQGSRQGRFWGRHVLCGDALGQEKVSEKVEQPYRWPSI